MAITYSDIASLCAHGFDQVIDVRSPAEFAQDHIPGAINLPALSNEERARVGTIYKQVSPFDARKVGAALVARNAAHAIETALADKPGSWRPLVYCWRGGQRSGSFASILQQIGWRADTVQGGYQTWRRLVTAAAYDGQFPHRLILIDGNTGTAKTALLERLAAMGHQTLDLEGLAGHRGSLLGLRAAGQPPQKSFDSQIALAITQTNPDRPLIIEAESSKIGRINLPPALWHAMVAAPRIFVDVPFEARANYLVQAYGDVIADHDRLRRLLQPLRYFRGHAMVDKWESLLASNDHLGLARALMQDHYDQAYAKSRRVHTHTELGTVSADTLDDAGQTALAAQIDALIARAL